MHDIRLIRENPAAFDAALALRGVEPVAQSILATDAQRRDIATRMQEVQARRNEGNAWLLAHDAANDIRPAVFRFAVENGLQVLGLQKSERGLEEVFKELTRH